MKAQRESTLFTTKSLIKDKRKGSVDVEQKCSLGSEVVVKASVMVALGSDLVYKAV